MAIRALLGFSTTARTQFTFAAADFSLQVANRLQSMGFDGSELTRFRLSDAIGIGLDGHPQLFGGRGNAQAGFGNKFDSFSAILTGEYVSVWMTSRTLWLDII